MKNKLRKVQIAAVSALLLGAPMLANATPPTEFELPALPMGAIYTLGGVILAGLGVMWGWRKLVKTTNKS